MKLSIFSFTYWLLHWSLHKLPCIYFAYILPLCFLISEWFTLVSYIFWIWSLCNTLHTSSPNLCSLLFIFIYTVLYHTQFANFDIIPTTDLSFYNWSFQCLKKFFNTMSQRYSSLSLSVYRSLIEGLICMFSSVVDAVVYSPEPISKAFFQLLKAVSSDDLRFTLSPKIILSQGNYLAQDSVGPQRQACIQWQIHAGGQNSGSWTQFGISLKLQSNFQALSGTDLVFCCKASKWNFSFCLILFPSLFYLSYSKDTICLLISILESVFQRTWPVIIGTKKQILKWILELNHPLPGWQWWREGIDEIMMQPVWWPGSLSDFHWGKWRRHTARRKCPGGHCISSDWKVLEK